MDFTVSFERKITCNLSSHHNVIGECNFDYGFYLKTCELVKLIIIILQVVIGVIGNVLSLVVWIRGNICSKLACSVYFRLLAATDLIVLIVSCGFPFIYEYYKYGTEKPVPRLDEISKYSDETWFYAGVTFIKRVGPQISPWLLTVISIERTLSLCFPFKFQLKGCKKRAIILYVCILVVILGMSSSMFYIDLLVPGTLGYELKEDHYVIEIPISMKIEEGLKIWSLCVLPLGFMLVCNLTCLIQIIRMRIRIAGVNVNPGSTIARRNSRVGLFTAICLASGILHCVSVVPTLVYTVRANRLLSFKYYVHHRRRRSFLGYCRYHFNAHGCPMQFGAIRQITRIQQIKQIEQIKQKLSIHISEIYGYEHVTFTTSYLFLHTLAVCSLFLNNSVNFFLFCVSGKDFRRDLRTLFRCK